MARIFRSIAAFAASVATCSLLSGCTGFGPQGGFFSQTRIGVYGNDMSMLSRKGEACSISILQLVALGNASAELAAKNGSIEEVHSIDIEGFNVLGIYTRSCTVVRGE